MQERTKWPESIAIYIGVKIPKIQPCARHDVRSHLSTLQLKLKQCGAHNRSNQLDAASVALHFTKSRIDEKSPWTLLTGFSMKIPTARVNRRPIPSAKNDFFLHHRRVFNWVNRSISRYSRTQYWTARSPKFYLVFGRSCFICALMNDLNLFVHILINDPN